MLGTEPQLRREDCFRPGMPDVAELEEFAVRLEELVQNSVRPECLVVAK